MKKILAAIFSLTLLFGCSNEGVESPKGNDSSEVKPEKQIEMVTVLVTKNNGEESVVEKEIEINTEEEVTVMDVMKENFEIETQFDGAFISSINGVAASEADKTSWFYSVNGEEAMVGANEYQVKPNDKIEFDLHTWE